MSSPIRLLGFGSALLLMLIPLGVGLTQEPTGDEAAALCAECHDNLAARLSQTVHGPLGSGVPSCVTCHGDGTRHVEEADPELIGMPAGVAGERLCRSCHTGGLQAEPAGSGVHASGSVYCGDCHQIHAADQAAPNLLTTEPEQLCLSCHPFQQAAFRRPFGHRLERGGVACVSCHDPHGGRGENSLRRDHSGQGPCVTCHAEKRGPFVFPHVADTSGNCLSCHLPHGSSNPMQLTRSRVDQLCLECHSTLTAGVLGSQPPSFHDLRSPRYRECTVCHVAVHGSNSSPALLK